LLDSMTHDCRVVWGTTLPQDIFPLPGLFVWSLFGNAYMEQLDCCDLFVLLLSLLSVYHDETFVFF